MNNLSHAYIQMIVKSSAAAVATGQHANAQAVAISSATINIHTASHAPLPGSSFLLISALLTLAFWRNHDRRSI